MKLSSESAAKAIEILCSLAERTRVDPGCISSRVYRDVQQEHTIMIDQVWSSQEDLRQHLRAPGYQRVLLVVEMAKGQPEIRFSTISHTSGFETIAEARSNDVNLAHSQ